jgi:hypothetical protein
VRSCLLDVAERDAGVERGGDKCGPQCMRPDGLGDPGPSRYPADDPRGSVPVQPAAIGGKADWAFAALADGQVDRPRGARRERDRDDLAALAGND